MKLSISFSPLALGLLGLSLVILPSCHSPEPVLEVTRAPSMFARRSVAESADDIGEAAKYFNKQLDQIAPTVPAAGDHDIFASYNAAGPATWANNWTQNIDLSGVAWDTDRAGVLIGRRFVLLATHYPRKLNSNLVFHDRNGQTHVRKLIDLRRVGPGRITPDVSVGYLDSPVPLTVTTYPILPGGWPYEKLLQGAKVIVTHKTRKVSLYEVYAVRKIYNQNYERLFYRKGITTGLDPAWQLNIGHGDSGQPVFILWDGRLVLMATHTFGGLGGSGPFYGNDVLQAEIREKVDTIRRENPNS